MRTPPVRPLTAAALAAVAAAMAFAAAPLAAQQDAPITKAAFASLRWLEGRWVGSGGGYAAFHEEYVFLNDSTIEQREHADSTFGVPRRTSTIEWRAGRVLKRRDGRAETQVVRIAGDTARFEPVVAGRGGFTWHRVADGHWRALLDRAGATPVVYDLRRVGARGRPAPADARVAGGAPETEAVRRAALDYLEGFYEGDSTKHLRSVHPSVFKYGFSRTRSGEYRGSQMPWPGFHAYTRGVREEGRGGPPPNAPKEVRIYEVLDQTASAKVTAWWGIDYLLLAKFDGRWMITHVLWQSPPPA